VRGNRNSLLRNTVATIVATEVPPSAIDCATVALFAGVRALGERRPWLTEGESLAFGSRDENAGAVAVAGLAVVVAEGELVQVPRQMALADVMEGAHQTT